jgi:ABC-type transporter Mla subunit MlaD
MTKFKKKSVYSFLFIVLVALGALVFGFAAVKIFSGPSTPDKVYYEPDTK